MQADPYLNFERDGEHLIVNISGDWIVRRASELSRRLEDLSEAAVGIKRITMQCDGVQDIDTAGAWMLFKAARDLNQHGFIAELRGFKEEHFKFIRKISEVVDEETCHGVHQTLADLMEGLGRLTIAAILHVGQAIGFFGRLFVSIGRSLRDPTRLRLPSIVAHMHRAGVDAIPIVGMMAFLISIVLAYQGASQLERFGAEIFTINLTAISILREMGVVLTAILIAGRSGSAFAAEIGVMKLNEEIDALETMGLDPFEVLVLPRLFALLIMLPLLTLVADIVGLAGGALSVLLLIGVPLNQYLDQVQAAITPWTFWVGMMKAPVFAFIIATVATFRGMQATGSAESVGKLTTISVVQSIFLVIVADAVFSIVFTNLGI